MFINMDNHHILHCSAQSAAEITAAAKCACRDFELEDMQTHLEQLQTQVADCELIRDLTTDRAERDLFQKFSEHFRVLATEVERAIAARTPTQPRRRDWS
jgi:hypothetical protein